MLLCDVCGDKITETPEFVMITILDGSERIPQKVPMHVSCSEKFRDFLRAVEEVVVNEEGEEDAEI